MNESFLSSHASESEHQKPGDLELNPLSAEESQRQKDFRMSKEIDRNLFVVSSSADEDVDD